MNNIDNLQLHVGSHGANRWLALTLQPPYLCLEAESRDALLEKVRRALAFCHKVAAQFRERETQPFLATEIISSRELEDA